MVDGVLAAALEKEGDDIARNEDLGHPSHGHEAQILSVKVGDCSAEDHVYGRGVQRRREQNHQRLQGVKRDGDEVIAGDDSTDVSDDLDCIDVNIPSSIERE